MAKNRRRGAGRWTRERKRWVSLIVFAACGSAPVDPESATGAAPTPPPIETDAGASTGGCRLVALPHSVTFEGVPVGRTRVETVILENRGTQNCAVTGLAVSTDPLSEFSFPADGITNEGAPARIPFEIAPARTGTFALRFVHQEYSWRNTQVVVSLGQSPNLVVGVTATVH